MMKKNAFCPFSTSKAGLFMVRRRKDIFRCRRFRRFFLLPVRLCRGASETKFLYNKFSGRIWVMKPLNDRVLVKRLESEEKTAGGLFIPDAAKEKPSKGEVIACGPGKLNEKGERVAMEVKPGDVVLFTKYAGTEIKVNGADHIIMREEDILAILD